jgi:hypothetical protein
MRENICERLSPCGWNLRSQRFKSRARPNPMIESCTLHVNSFGLHITTFAWHADGREA